MQPATRKGAAPGVKRSPLIALLVFLALVALTAAFGAQFEAGAWHAALAKPSWNPPNWVFGPVWSVLYLAIAVAGWRVWLAARRINAALFLWGAQLLLNALWSWLFFGLHRPALALIDIAWLLGLIAAFIAVARRDSELASLLFIPYGLWVGFASALNFAIWRLN